MFSRKIKLLMIGLMMIQMLNAQDLHFADIQQMGQWYNQALKMDRYKDLRVDFKNIQYQGLIAFRTGTALINIPLVKKEYTHSDEGKSYINLTGGAAFDKQNSGTYKNTVGLLGISYTQLLTANRLYASVGFQGTVTNIRFTGEGTYPDQVDQYGPVTSRPVTNDPLHSGKTFNYISLNAGIAIFKKSNVSDWYIGTSIRHANEPYTEDTKSTLYRLAPTYGAQAGINFKSDVNIIDLYGALNWKAEANEYMAGIRYNFILQNNKSEESKTTFGFGCLYRIHDAFIPDLKLEYHKTQIAFYYDMNISGIRSSSFTRKGFELILTQKF